MYVLLYTCMYLYIYMDMCSDFQLLHPDTVGPKVSYTPRGDTKCTADGTGRDPSLVAVLGQLVGCRVGSQKIPTKINGMNFNWEISSQIPTKNNGIGTLNKTCPFFFWWSFLFKFFIVIVFTVFVGLGQHFEILKGFSQSSCKALCLFGRLGRVRGL